MIKKDMTKYHNVWKGLKITNSAAVYITSIMKTDINIIGLRISIKRSGCAGFSYMIDKVTKKNTNDIIYEYKGAKIFISDKYMHFIDGTEIDYVREGLNEIFKFNNPKAQYTCGCNESFSL